MYDAVCVAVCALQCVLPFCVTPRHTFESHMYIECGVLGVTHVHLGFVGVTPRHTFESHV